MDVGSLLTVQDYYGPEDKSSYAEVLKKGIELVRQVGEMVPFEATSIIKYTDVWKFLEKLGTGEAESPLPCKIEYGPVTRGSMAMTVRSLKKSDDEPSKVLLLYRDEGVHGRVPEITFDMAVLIVQLLVTMVLAVMDENDDEMRAVVIGKMRELDELVLEEDLALVLIGRRAAAPRAPIVDPSDPNKGGPDDDDGVDGEADEITIDYANALDPDAIVKDLLKATDVFSVLTSAQGVDPQFKELIDDMTTKAKEEADKFQTIYLALKNLMADVTSAGGGEMMRGGGGVKKPTKKLFRRAMRAVMYGGADCTGLTGEDLAKCEADNMGSPDQDDSLVMNTNPGNSASQSNGASGSDGATPDSATAAVLAQAPSKTVEQHNHTFAAAVTAVNLALGDDAKNVLGEFKANTIPEVPAVRGRLVATIQRIVTLYARGVYERSLNTLSNLSDFSTMAMAIRPKSKDDDSLTLKMPKGYQSDGKLVDMFQELPKDVATIEGESITLRGIHKAASDMAMMPNLKITKPTVDEDGAMDGWGMLRDMDLMPAAPMTIDDFANKTRGSIGAQPLQNVMILMSAVQSKLEEISAPLSMTIVILMCMTDNRRIINERLVSKRLLTFVKLNYIEFDKARGGRLDASEIVPSLFQDIRSDWVNNKSSMLQMKHVAHPKPYIFGPFNSVIHKLVPREVTGRDWTNNQGMFDNIAAGNDVVILGYGASGAGKTSFLVAMTGGKREGVDSTGVFSYILKFISEKLGVSQFTLDVHQAMSEDVFNQSATALDDKGKAVKKHDVNKTMNVPTGDKQTYKLAGKVLEQDQISLLEKFLEVKVTEPAFRETWATVNNANSSRTHAIVRVEFGSTDEEKAKYGRILLGDLAGYENHFDCRLSSMPGFNMPMYMAMYNESAKVRASANQPQSIWQIEEVLEKRKQGLEPGEDFYLPKWKKTSTDPAPMDGYLLDDSEGGKAITDADGMWTSDVRAKKAQTGGADDAVKKKRVAVTGQPNVSTRRDFKFNKAESSDETFAKVVYSADFTQRNVLQKIADEFNKEYGLKPEETDKFATPENLAKRMRAKIGTYYKFRDDNTLQGGKPPTPFLNQFVTQSLDDLFKNTALGDQVADEMELLPAVLAGDSDQLIHPRGAPGEAFNTQTELDVFFNKIIYGKDPYNASQNAMLDNVLKGTTYKVFTTPGDNTKFVEKTLFERKDTLGNKGLLPLIDLKADPNPLAFFHGEGGAKKYANANVKPGDYWKTLCNLQGQVKAYAGQNQAAATGLKNLKAKLSEALKTELTDTLNLLKQWYFVQNDNKDSAEKWSPPTINGKSFSRPVFWGSRNIESPPGAQTASFFAQLQSVGNKVKDLIGELQKTPTSDPNHLNDKESQKLFAMLPPIVVDPTNAKNYILPDHDLKRIYNAWFANNTETGDKAEPGGESLAVYKTRDKFVATPDGAVGFKKPDGTIVTGQTMLDYFDSIKKGMTDYKGITVYPDGLYFFLHTMTDGGGAAATATASASFPDELANPKDIACTLFDRTFRTLNGGKSPQELFTGDDEKAGSKKAATGAAGKDEEGLSSVEFFNKFNEAGMYSMLIYLNIWRLKGEVLAKSLVLAEHCLDRDVEATFIIGTLDQLSSFVRTAIFDQTGVAYPPIHVTCLNQMLKSVRYEASKPTTLEKLIKLDTLNWLGLPGDGKLRGEFVFCLAAVVNTSDIPTSQQQSLNKYVDVSDVKAAVYNKDQAALLAALEDLVGWRSTRVDERADPVAKKKDGAANGATNGATNGASANGATNGSTNGANGSVNSATKQQGGAGSIEDIDTPAFPLATGRVIQRLQRPFKDRKEWVWGGKINWDAQDEPLKLMAPLRAAVQSIRDKLDTANIKPAKPWPAALDMTAQQADIDVYNKTVQELTEPWSKYDNTMLMQSGELAEKLKTDATFKKVLASIATPALFAAAMRFCEYVDNDNESTAMGVMAFMDKMSKFGKTNTVCHVDEWDETFVLDQKRPWLANAAANNPYANSSTPKAPTTTPSNANAAKPQANANAAKAQANANAVKANANVAKKP